MYRKKKEIKPDVVLKEYWKDNTRFADFFNSVLFKGKELIKPCDLKDADTESSFIVENKNYAGSISAARDNIKLWKQFGVSLALLGMEDQDSIHYGMSVRLMGYDYAAYKKQCDAISAKNKKAGIKIPSEYLSGMKKTDKIIPVITAVVYYGQEEWDGATSLYGLFDMPEELKDFINDYKIILIEARNADTEFNNKDNRDFFYIMQKILNCKRMDKNVKNDIIQYCRENDVDIPVVKAVAGAAKAGIDYSVLEKGDDDMCTLFEEIKREGIKEGKKEGRKEGAMAIIKMCHEFNIPDEAILTKICSNMDISLEEATDYLKEYKDYYI